MEERRPNEYDQASGGGLEDHLRGLILGNPPSKPPHGRGTELQQQDGFATQGNRSPMEKTPIPPTTQVVNATSATADSSIRPDSQSSRPGRKRLNQAQRRQLSSQLSIQIDPRAREPLVQNGQPGYARSEYQPHTFSPAHRGHQHSQTVPGHMHVNSTQTTWNTSPQSPSPHHTSYHGNFNRTAAYVGDQSSGRFARRGSGPMYSHRRDSRVDVNDPEIISAQADLLNQLCFTVVQNSEIEISEIAEKENFRQRIEAVSQATIAAYEQQNANNAVFPPDSIQLKCFGSLSSGFATKASDMDLGLLSPLSLIQPDEPGSPVPRLLEKALLEAGFGARLLTRTRVPIIKLCESPPDKLREDLLAERKKWEEGSDNDGQDAQDDEDARIENESHDHANEHVRHETVSGALAPDAAESAPGISKGSQIFKLKQGPDQPLSAYYLQAKRTLRKVGARDVTISNHHDFSLDDWKLLNAISQAFFEGLADRQLRDFMAKYPSLSFQPEAFPNHFRSLHGVSIQIEGEQILAAWRAWPQKELFPFPEAHAEVPLRFWTNAQQRLGFGADPVAYNKELQLALEKIKKIPTVQLLTLEQAQHETPSQYHARANQAVFALRPQHGIMSEMAREVIVERYIMGIYSTDIKEQMRSAMATFPAPTSLNAVARQHKSLHLAKELRTALDNDLYDAALTEDIERYIKVLQLPFKEVAHATGTTEVLLPLPYEMDGVINRIRALRDPHTLAPNQPRDRYKDRLEFPKEGAGVQCDINFSAHLALQNTLLLRCYSHTDPRVRPMVLFIKHWAKVREINSGYRGTLSSYGYVLMVLHYLVNVARPFVCPNLQQLAREPPPNPSPLEVENTIICRGHNIQFWRNEQEIIAFAQANQLNHNPDSIGHLLRGFFEYFAQSGPMSSGYGKGFDWGRDVLSLRSPGGLLSKQTKGWTGAKTVLEVHGGGANSAASPIESPVHQQMQSQTAATDLRSQAKPLQQAGKADGFKEVRHRYLFAIEDPFELDHNVARTVTHNGIVSIRDEFRRAWRIIRSTVNANPTEDLLQDASKAVDNHGPFMQLLDDIHGVRAGGGVRS